MLTISDFLSIIESGECHNINPRFHKGVVIEVDGYFYGLSKDSNYIDELDWDYRSICDTDGEWYLFAFRNE